MTVTLALADVDAYALGCAALGSGGGGAVVVATHILRSTLAQAAQTKVVPLAEIPPSATVALVGAVGSPTVMAERLPGGDEFAHAIARLEKVLGSTVDAVAPLEIGGVNGLFGVVAALRSGRILVDADGMGRAYPRLDQCVLSGVVPAGPLVLVAPSGGCLVLEEADSAALGRTVVGVLPALGAWAAVAGYAAGGSAFAAHAVPGSVIRALVVGRALMAGVIEIAAGMRLLGSGVVAEVLRHEARRPRGIVTLTITSGDGGTMRVDHSEEFLCAVVDGELAASAPDVITLVDARTWSPIGVAEVRTGQRVHVLCLEASAVLRRRPDVHGLAGCGYLDPAEAAA